MNTRFGPYEVRSSSRELYKFNTKVKLRPQPFQVLSLLLSRAGQVVTREELQRQLWPSDTFVGFEESLNTTVKELRAALCDSAVQPRYIETLPRLGYRFIFPVEHSTPEPEPGQVPVATPKPKAPEVFSAPRRTWPRKWASAAAILLLGISVLAVGRGVFGRPPSTTASAVFRPRPSIAVLGFRNMSGKPEQDWMSTAVAAMLDAELASGQQIRVIPAENVARMNLDLSLPPADTYGRETLDKIHNHLGTDIVVSGSYLALLDGTATKLRIVLQVQDTRTGETIASFTKDGTEGDLPQLVSESGENLRRILGIGSLSAAAAREVRASSPNNSEAARLYAEGLARLQGFDALGARALLEKAIAADPDHALSHSALAESLSVLGYDPNAQDEAKKAFDLSPNLAREDRLSIEGRYRELMHDPPAALDIYHTLHSFFPDNLDYGLRFAKAQITANHAAEALQTIAALRSLPAPGSKDPRLDLAEASAAERLGDMKRSQKAAAASGARAKDLGSGLMSAAALVEEAWTWINLGEPEKAIADYTRARELWLAAGDTYSAARALHGIAIAQKDSGVLPEARKSYEEALKEFRLVGANASIASCSHNLGILFFEQGQLDLAKERLEEALRIQSAQNDKRAVSSDLDDLGNVIMLMGQLSSAKHMKEQALQGFRDVGDKRGESISGLNLADILYRQGELSAATEGYNRAIVLQKEISYERGLAASLSGLAEVLTAQDRLDEALSSTQQSLALREQSKQHNLSAQSDVQLAEIALDRGRPAEAESLVRSAVSVLENNQSLRSASQAYSVLARSLVAQGKLSAATTAATQASALAQRSGDRMVRMQAGFAKAEVEILSGKAEAAERNLTAFYDQAKAGGYTALELQARLLLAKAELRSGKPAVARARLESLQSDAHGRGFLLIARQASESIPIVR